MSKSYVALGLMSGTSLDGIDAAILRTDGEKVEEVIGGLTRQYDDNLRSRLRKSLGKQTDCVEVERDLTLAHVEVVRDLLKKEGLGSSDIDVIGFHGQTVYHAPKEGVTKQIGDGGLLAEEVGIDVVCDFRSADVAAGGEGFCDSQPESIESPSRSASRTGVGFIFSLE